MESNEFALREIKDRIVAVAGSIEENCSSPAKKGNHHQLTRAATELHKCADDMQSILMRIKHR